MIQIKHKLTGKVLLEGDFKTIKELINANSDKVLNLRGANLSKADLSGANLSEADLSEADLSWADLSWAKGKFIFNWGVKLEVVQ